MTDALRPSDLSRVDPQTADLIAAEERRQRDKIILIPSESLTPPAVREALGSVFTSLYAEGYPRLAMTRLTQEELADLDLQLAFHRRYADRRFYKGTEFADLIESLACRRAAECFATPQYPAERIYANVQALSGAAANLAVYESFVQPGETVMGMALTEGGHLTHGSEFNVTGKRYRIVSYAVDPKTGKLDYDRMLALAREHRPRMIIGGFTSYPWRPDWKAYREIADEVGAIFLADIAHTAGMVIAGVYPNPIGIADVVMFTTHKTLCGPRGAVLLSTDPAVASAIDSAVFPGEQGGPHVNKFAAIAAALKLAHTKEFRDLQKRIVENAAHLAESLAKEGIPLAYGGTDTHLLVLDLRGLGGDTGFVMMGEVAARVLDLVGIVANKNTIPKDHSAADAHGIRIGTPWATQRGMGKEEMVLLAKIMAKVLRAIRPFSYPGLTGELSRGKIPLAILEEAKGEVCDLLARVDPEVAATPRREPAGGPWHILRVRGGRTISLLEEAATSDLSSLKVGEERRTLLFNGEGRLLSEAIVGRTGEEEALVLVPREQGEAVKAWLAGLADGYVLFDREDLFRKVQGPAVVEEAPPSALSALGREWLKLELPRARSAQDIRAIYEKEPALFAPWKPYFVGQGRLDLGQSDPTRTSFSFKEKEGALRRTPLYEEHRALGAKLVPFAGWEMPVWYSSALEEHRAVRERAGLFDLGHMGVFEVSGEGATAFLDIVSANYAAWLEDGQSQYTYLLDPDGNAIDDFFVYRRAKDRYLLVVNAANAEKDWEWLTGVNEGRFLIDREIPIHRPASRVVLRDLKDEEGRMDVALQGPQSPKILGRILGKRERIAVSALKRTEFCEVEAKGHPLIVARTGYTGEEKGYEIYVRGEDAPWLWQSLLKEGKPLGLLPCGLAARDSTRTEAGLPLYGHELAGPHGVNPFEAGFGPYVKLHKAFFVGRRACVRAYTGQTREVVRFRVEEAGARPIRAGAAVIDRSGSFLGRGTSSVSLGETQVGMALLERRGIAVGTPIILLNPPHGKAETGKASSALAAGDRVAVPIPATVVPRFQSREVVPEPGAE
jgi:glycine hydroxymethyltransferase